MKGVMAGCISKRHYFGKTNLEASLSVNACAAKQRARRVWSVLEPKPSEFAGWRGATRRTAQAI